LPPPRWPRALEGETCSDQIESRGTRRGPRRLDRLVSHTQCERANAASALLRRRSAYKFTATRALQFTAEKWQFTAEKWPTSPLNRPLISFPHWPTRAMPPGEHTRANALQHRWSDEKEKGDWYAGGFAYWSGEAATNDGMLGGFADVDVADTADSLKFMKRCGALPESQRNGGSRVIRALDVGAGIGRVTAGALLQLADTVDLLESDAKFVERAKGALAWAAPRVERFHCQPMQEFVADYVENKPGMFGQRGPSRLIG
jgi:hypothetical protein